MYFRPHYQKMFWPVALFVLIIGIVTPQAFPRSPLRPKRAQTLSDLIEHFELTEGVETIGGASMEDAVLALRERTDFPVALEMLEFQRPEGFVTLGDALAKLHQIRASGTLGVKDQGRLDRYEEMAQTHDDSTILVPRQIAFTLVEDRITVRNLLDRLMTLDDEYRWKNYGTESAPLIVIEPRAGSALEWPVPPICHPRPIEYAELFGGCNNRECGAFSKLLSDRNMSVIYMGGGPVSPGEQPPDPRPHGLIDVCTDHLTARDVLNLTVKSVRTSWTLAGIKGMRLISFDPSVR